MFGIHPRAGGQIEYSATGIRVQANEAPSASDRSTLLARGRLADARKWFTHLGWAVLPQTTRGLRILSWGADHAYLANLTRPKHSLRRWCRKWAPWLSEAQLAGLVADTVERNERGAQRWSHDQCAAVLEVSIRDKEALGFRFIGADDDPNYEIRLTIKREKAAARARKSRAKHSTGAKRGRPALRLSIEERLQRKRAQGAKRSKKLRASRKNASRDIIVIGGVTELSVTRDPTANPGEDSRAPEAPGREAPLRILDGEIIIDRDIVPIVPPSPSHTERAIAFVRRKLSEVHP